MDVYKEMKKKAYANKPYTIRLNHAVEIAKAYANTIKQKKHTDYRPSNLVSYKYIPDQKLFDKGFCDSAAGKLHQSLLNVPYGIFSALVPKLLRHIQRSRPELKVVYKEERNDL